MTRHEAKLASLPLAIKRNVEALKGIQIERTELQNKYKRECLELEKKYLELQTPLDQLRLAIVTGAFDPTPKEMEAGQKQSLKDDPNYVPLPPLLPNKAGIPEFWLTSLRNHVGISELVTDRDAVALKHLLDIRISYFPSKEPQTGFKLIFVFSPNDFFQNKILEKMYLYRKEVGYSGDFEYERAIGTEIQWKEDKDLTKEFEIMKQRNKTTHRTRLVRKAHPIESFFNFFSPPVPPAEGAIENEEIKKRPFMFTTA